VAWRLLGALRRITAVHFQIWRKHTMKKLIAAAFLVAAVPVLAGAPPASKSAKAPAKKEAPAKEEKKEAAAAPATDGGTGK
jgi:hypothetical protein